MTALGHIATTSLVQGHPVIRLLWGFISHWVLDTAVDEYRPRGLHLTDSATWNKHSLWLLWQVVGVLLFAVLTKDYMAILYGLFPDIVEGVYIKYRLWLHNDNVWMSGKLLFPFHRAGKEYWVRLSGAGTFVLEIGLLVVAVLA